MAVLKECHQVSSKLFCEKGHLGKAVTLLSQLDATPSSHTYLCLLKACTHKKALLQARQVHSRGLYFRVALLCPKLTNTYTDTRMLVASLDGSAAFLYTQLSMCLLQVSLCVYGRCSDGEFCAARHCIPSPASAARYTTVATLVSRAVAISRAAPFSDRPASSFSCSRPLRFHFCFSYLAGSPVLTLSYSYKDGSQVSLGTYTSVEGGGGEQVVVNRQAASGWETFKIWRYADGIYNFRVFNNKFMSALNARGGDMKATGVNAREWERFTLTRNPNNRVQIRAYNGMYRQVFMSQSCL